MPAVPPGGIVLDGQALRDEAMDGAGERSFVAPPLWLQPQRPDSNHWSVAPPFEASTTATSSATVTGLPCLSYQYVITFADGDT